MDQMFNVDGVSTSSDTFSDTMPSTSSEVIIGNTTGTATNLYDSKISNLRVVRTAAIDQHSHHQHKNSLLFLEPHCFAVSRILQQLKKQQGKI